MRFPFLVAVGVALCFSCLGQSRAERYDIIPAPAELEPQQGAFIFDDGTRLLHDSAAGKALAEYCRDELTRSTGLPLPVDRATGRADANNALLFCADSPAQDVPPEGYRITVTPSCIRVTGADPAGCFYGFQTLRQLMPPQIYSLQPVTGMVWSVPAVRIQDQPRFRWRGFMLDVSRNFFDVPTLKRVMDSLAMHKLNVFHLHLTDIQAWRLEIEAYPELTSPAATRARYYKGEHKPYFTRRDVEDILAYARARHITVVPEIDMPGHAGAAVDVYPELGDGHNTFNPGKKETYTFLQNVLLEVMDMFPAPYVHIGADEVRGRHHWADLPAVEALMKERDFESFDEVEAYFDRRMTDFIAAHGKVPCGWDEVAAFDVTPEFIAFWWRRREDLDVAVKKGYRVVACPYEYTYFNRPPQMAEHGLGPSVITTRKVYEWEPVQAWFTREQENQVLGVQACLWTPCVGTLNQLFYMIHPRLAALAEVAWTARDSRHDITAFRRRVDTQIERYDRAGMYCRRPMDNLRVADWQPNDKGVLPPLELDLTSYVHGPQDMGLVFYLDKGDTPYDKIESVELLADGKVAASPQRLYFRTADKFHTHVYLLDFSTFREGTTYRLRAVPEEGESFQATVYVRPFAQPESYCGPGIPWTYWPSRDGTVINTEQDRPLPPGENMLRNSSFEEDRSIPFIDYWYMAYAGNAELDDTAAKHGERSVRLEPERFNRDITYKYITNLENGKPYTFSIWAKSDRPGSLLLAHVGPEASHPAGLCTRWEVGTEWQRFIWTFTLPADMKTRRNRYQLGLMNPAFYYPEWKSGMLDQGPRPTRRREDADQIVIDPPNGVIWLDAAQLEAGRSATDYGP